MSCVPRTAFRLTVLLALFATFLPAPVRAGWGDRAPSAINLADNPGVPDIHHNSGHRRIVRIRNTTLALVPHGESGEYTYRSTDDGATWTQIDTDGRYSGSLITGPDSLVYHFYRSGGALHMVRFKYNTPAPLPAPVAIYSNSAINTTGVWDSRYIAISATVDSTGTLYVAAHWGSPDRIHVIRSEDGGDTWQGPWQVSTDNTTPWNYPHIEVDAENELVMTYDHWQGNQMMFARSRDRGETWTNKLVHNGEAEYTSNPTVLPVGRDTVFIMVQGKLPGGGVFVTRSTDHGANFGAFTLVEPTCGYGDPSMAVGADGTLYAAFRTSRNTGLSGECGPSSREKLARSLDGGRTWAAVDSFYNTTAPGTRSQLRYQTWFNYGGPLQWIWMQQGISGHNPIYYDINADVSIRSRESAPPPPPPPGPRVTTASLPDGREGQAYSATLSASAGTAPYTWAVTAGSLPAGLTLSAGGTLAGTPTQPASPTLTVEVTDAAGLKAERQLALRILSNRKPRVTSPASVSATAGAAFRYVAAASDSDGGTPRLAFLGLPAWLAADGEAVSGTAPAASGTATFRVTASDGRLEDTLLVTVTIAAVNRPPVIDSVRGGASAREGDTATLRAFARDADGDAVRYRWTLGSAVLADGPAACVYVPDLRSAGTRTITVTVEDGRGGRADARADIQVANRPVPPMPLTPEGAVPRDGELTWGWSGSPDPDLDSASLRFRAVAYSDSLLTRILVRRDSLRVRRLALGEIAGSIPEPTTAWFRVEAFDARGYSTGFGPARRYVIGDLTPTASASAARGWHATLQATGGDPGLVVTVPAGEAGRHLIATLLDARGQHRALLFEGILEAGRHRLALPSHLPGSTGIRMLRLESGGWTGTYLVPAW